MQLQIITPEYILFDGEAESITLPGKSGSFQILNQHAPIVSSLINGTIKVVNGSSTIETKSDKISQSTNEKDTLLIKIDSGIIEMNDNKIVILAE
jgi:F-type H+-transporting ATPase subunit epsilon